MHYDYNMKFIKLIVVFGFFSLNISCAHNNKSLNDLLRDFNFPVNNYNYSISDSLMTDNSLPVDEEYGRPLLVLLEIEHWSMVYGSYTPSFVLYENGRIIYTTIENGMLKRNFIELTLNQRDEFIESLSIDNILYDFERFLSALSSASYSPATIITMAAKGLNHYIFYFDITQKKNIMIYGDLEGNSDNSRNILPANFVQLYDTLKNYKNDNAVDWIPPKIEIMFWDYDHAPNSRPWIEGFPDLYSASTIHRDSGLYSVFIEWDRREEFSAYLRQWGSRGAVEINDKKMAMSYRIPFPNIDRLNLLSARE